MVKHLLNDGYHREDILVLAPTGPKGIRVENHDCLGQSMLPFLGKRIGVPRRGWTVVMSMRT